MIKDGTVGSFALSDNDMGMQSFKKKSPEILKNGSVKSFALTSNNVKTLKKSATLRRFSKTSPLMVEDGTVGSFVVAKNVAKMQGFNKSGTLGKASERPPVVVKGGTVSPFVRSKSGSKSRKASTKTVEVQMKPLFDALAAKKLLLALMDYTVGSFSEKATLRFGSGKSKSKSLGRILKQSESFVPNYLADAGRCTCDVVFGIISDSAKSSDPKSRRGRVCAFCQSIPEAKLVDVNEPNTRHKTRRSILHNLMIYLKAKGATRKNSKVSILWRFFVFCLNEETFRQIVSCKRIIIRSRFL